MVKRCKKCKVPLEGLLYRWIASKLFGIKRSEKDPDFCNKCAQEKKELESLRTEGPWIKVKGPNYTVKPFFFWERNEKKQMRLVIWTSELSQLKEVFYKILQTFSEIVEVRLEIEELVGNNKWTRYGGEIPLIKLIDIVKSNEDLIFLDGSVFFGVRNKISDESICVSEHGVLFIYSNSQTYLDKIAGICKEAGFESRIEKLIYQSKHWHRSHRNLEELKTKFVAEAELRFEK